VLRDIEKTDVGAEKSGMPGGAKRRFREKFTLAEKKKYAKE
jgi:hypothetical protein